MPALVCLWGNPVREKGSLYFPPEKSQNGAVMGNTLISVVKSLLQLRERAPYTGQCPVGQKFVGKYPEMEERGFSVLRTSRKLLGPI